MEKITTHELAKLLVSLAAKNTKLKKLSSDDWKKLIESEDKKRK